MSMIKLAFQNFKTSFRNYLSLIISLAFTILIFLNFQNIVYSETLNSLGESNMRNVEIIIQAISFVLGCFMLFFVWYATNVFLTKRKKEIGIYVFMGLTNQKIGQLYMIETTMIGMIALAFGLFFGVITTQLFQMILMAISDISVNIQLVISLKPIIITTIVYLIIYIIFVLKGYVNIVKSSVLEMVSASKQNEYVQQKTLILIFKAILGIGILGTGFYYAIKEGGIEVMGHVLLAVILVVIGVYLLFGGAIPLLFQSLAKRKMFLYKKQRNLWINNVIFRMKKNYRTYAIVCVLMICSVTALATGFAMKQRYEGIVHFRNTYTYQFTSDQDNIDEKIQSLINQDNKVDYHTSIPILQLDDSQVNEGNYQHTSYMLVSYSDMKRLAKDAHLEFHIQQPKNDEIINVSQLHLLSFITDTSNITVSINNQTYKQIDETSIPYLGTFQEHFSFYLVNDDVYESLKSIGQQIYSYHYHIEDMNNFKASVDELNTIVSETEDNYTTYIVVDPASHDIEWVKILYSVCVFMFMVFILASGSILFMKLYNDAFEDKNRYEVLKKIGIDRKTLKKSIANELKFAYMAPFLVMSISSYFSVLSLAKLMETDLLMVNVISVLIIMIFFIICYFVSIPVYVKNAEIY